MSYSGLNSYTELAIAMLTSSNAFSEEYKRDDLAKSYIQTLNKTFIIQRKIIHLYFITEFTKTPWFERCKNLYFSEPIFATNKSLQIHDTTL